MCYNFYFYFLKIVINLYIIKENENFLNVNLMHSKKTKWYVQHLLILCIGTLLLILKNFSITNKFVVLYKNIINYSRYFYQAIKFYKKIY